MEDSFMKNHDNQEAKLESMIGELIHFFNAGKTLTPSYSPRYHSRISALTQIKNEYTYWAGASFNDQEDFRIKKLPGSCEPEEFWPNLKKRLEPTQTVVDLGSGIRPNFFLGQETTICVELFKPYLKYIRDTFPGEKTITVQEDVLSFLIRQPSNSIETVVVTDLIEHLSKDDGFSLIREIERTVFKQALIVTPRGFMPQHIGGVDAWGFTGNVLQNHISGWEEVDFKNWEVMFSENYYTEVDHPEGVIGCVFFPSKELRKDVHIVIEPFIDEKDMILKTSRLFQLLNDYLLFGRNHFITFTLPLFFSPKSIAIFPDLVMPEAPIEYVSFNWDVSNFYQTSPSGEVFFIPGTITNSVANIQAEVLLILTDKSGSKIKYEEVVKQGFTKICLDDDLLECLELYLESEQDNRKRNLINFIKTYNINE
jgi:hypothetical protein